MRGKQNMGTPAFIEVRAGRHFHSAKHGGCKRKRRTDEDNRPHAERGHETLIRRCGEHTQQIENKNMRYTAKSAKKVEISVFLSFFFRMFLHMLIFCCNFAAKIGLYSSTNDFKV